MCRAGWVAAERAFNRREPLATEYEMGNGRWSKRSVGGDERHSVEFGFKFRFDVHAGPRRNGVAPEIWTACSRERSLGEFPTFEAAAEACEDEARRLIEPALQAAEADYDIKFAGEQWAAYLARPKRLRSVKVQTRYK